MTHQVLIESYGYKSKHLMKEVAIIFPHQLIEDSPFLELSCPIYLIEEFLFFRLYKFHKQKLVFHRASMKAYEQLLKDRGKNVSYISAMNKHADIREFIPFLKEKGVTILHCIDPSDNWLEKRIKSAIGDLTINWYDSPLFINSKSELEFFFKKGKKKFFQTSFYKEQRRKRDILMEGDQPIGGKWTYDTENRKKYPKNKQPTAIYFPELTEGYKDAVHYVETNFKEHYGTISKAINYPINHQQAKEWFDQFLSFRFYEFGIYEDAIVAHAHFLNHSVLSPLINVGLLDPKEVINKAISYADANDIPINSTEGFVRQILGWREFIRGVYEVKGSQERTTNFWNFNRAIPDSFYDGTTGIKPVDDVIKKVLKTGYAHHIERLMVLSNFMVLCEFDPDKVYQWFMELFIDAYDWVMVPNVYGMSLFADGGIMSTKPYISGSNYIMKMSDYEDGDWQIIWDSLFWRFVNEHRGFFLNNPRTRLLVRNYDKMDDKKQESLKTTARAFLKQLDTKS